MMMKRGSSILVLAALLSSSSGCYRVNIVNGRPESGEFPALNGSTHGGYAYGLAEDGPVRLHGACKDGRWASIHVETGFISTFANLGYGYIFHGQDVTLKCAPEQQPEGAAPPIAPTAPQPSSICHFHHCPTP